MAQSSTKADVATVTVGAKTPVLTVPLNRERWLKSLRESIQKIKDAGQTVNSFSVVLEEWTNILEAEWAREKLETFPSHVEVPYVI